MLNCYRQENLGENGEFLSIDLHHKKTHSTRAGNDSIYVCEVKKDQNMKI